MNNQQNKTQAQQSDKFERFVVALGVCAGFLAMIAWHGVKRIKVKSVEFWLILSSLLMFTFYLAYNDYAHIRLMQLLWSSLFTDGVAQFFRSFSRLSHFIGLFLAGGYLTLVALGIKVFVERRRFQNALDEIGLKNANGVTPRLKSVSHSDGMKTKLAIRAKAIGVDRFEAKRGDLESAFESKVESIKSSKDRRFVEINLCKAELTKMLSYREVVDKLTKPYTFPVGESAEGIITKGIRELPHMLVAGVTGYGKSVFFKQVLLSLLKSPRCQLYLVDLKRVESTEFEPFPNVKIVKDERQAVRTLKALKEEMDRRYVYMEKIGVNYLEPKKHDRDLIVAAIDEASVLYGKTKVSKERAELVAQARELTHDLTKLARAAGIHMIVATQKPVSESLDTSSLENLPGRMIFKMSSVAGSNTALGNKRAYDLPDIKGRGIWRDGNQFIEVQAPYASPEELKEECQILATKIKSDANWNCQPLLIPSEESAKATSGFNKNVIKLVDNGETA